MNYLKHYYRLVNMAFTSNRSKSNGQYEAHHVKPKSLGGKRLVLLTAKEHYIAHFLLYKHFKNSSNTNAKIKMTHAFHAMTFSSNDNIIRYTSKSFAIARNVFYESMKGESHPFFGKSHSPETIERIKSSLANNETWKSNASNNMKQVRLNITKEQEEMRILKVKEVMTGKPHVMAGKTHSEESRKNMSEASIGKSKSELHKLNMSKGWEKRDIVTCPHCDKQSKNAGAMKRFHFDKCKRLNEDGI